MTTPLTLHVDRPQDGTLTLVVGGEIDLSNVQAFAAAVDAAVTESGAMVTVDLSAVEYLDSSGINVLFTYVDHIRVRATPLLLPVLTISGFTELADVQDVSATTDG